MGTGLVSRKIFFLQADMMLIESNGETNVPFPHVWRRRAGLFGRGCTHRYGACLRMSLFSSSGWSEGKGRRGTRDREKQFFCCYSENNAVAVQCSAVCSGGVHIRARLSTAFCRQCNSIRQLAAQVTIALSAIEIKLFCEGEKRSKDDAARREVASWSWHTETAGRSWPRLFSRDGSPASRSREHPNRVPWPGWPGLAARCVHAVQTYYVPFTTCTVPSRASDEDIAFIFNSRSIIQRYSICCLATNARGK